MELLYAILLFIVGLALLIKGGDWFVDGASNIAKRRHLPEVLVGATVVSIGTTLPEVMVSASAALAGHGEIAYGNAIGSIICNTALIAALTIAVRPGKTERRSLVLPVSFFLFSAVFYALVAYLTGQFSRVTGGVLLAIFVLYMVATVFQLKRSPVALPETTQEPAPAPDEKEEPAPRRHETLFDILRIVIGAVAIAIGADLLVDNGTLIATKLGVPESVIALTVVALGTSLPELVTAITALAKGHSDLSLGNIIGANLFNLVLVSGIATLISPFSVPSNTFAGGLNMSLTLEIPVMFGVMAVLCIPPLIGKRMYRWQGIGLLAVYLAFCMLQFVL